QVVADGRRSAHRDRVNGVAALDVDAPDYRPVEREGVGAVAALGQDALFDLAPRVQREGVDVIGDEVALDVHRAGDVENVPGDAFGIEIDVAGDRERLAVAAQGQGVGASAAGHENAARERAVPDRQVVGPVAQSGAYVVEGREAAQVHDRPGVVEV